MENPKHVTQTKKSTLTINKIKNIHKNHTNNHQKNSKIIF